ncbi:MAG: hypothetical protein KatS3mg015_0463 [Fimbriimonadales bacterium]|nr:MAG: hypothetical protein KatS3mg015_0463 [Fimbriimonadales bacterium]
MKRLIGLATLMVAASAVAQAPFTIVKPQEGANVRETVTVVFPKNSVPRGAFIGIAVDDKFIEATVPTLDEKLDALVYRLDTKAKQIPDGKHTLKVNLYMNIDGKPAIAETSEVTINVGNHAGINVPEDGLLIRYKWQPGRKNVYRTTVGIDLSTLTEAQNRMGGRAAQLPVAVESTRILYAVDDVKPGNIGLVRAQLLPDRGKDYTVVTAEGDSGPTMHYQEEFAPTWRLLDPAGREVYGDIPLYFSQGGEAVGESNMKLYVLIPLPVLPRDPVRIGDSWQGQIGLGGSIEKARELGRVSEYQPARGTFVNVEWEQGRPCAHLRYQIEVLERTRETETLKIMNREFRGGNRFKMQQDIWVTVDTGVLIRSDLVIEADQRMQQSTGSGGSGSGGGQLAGGRRGPSIAGGGGLLYQNDGGQQRNISPGGGGQGALTDPDMPGAGGRQGGLAGGGGQQGQGPAVFVRQKVYVKMIIES